LSIHNVTVNTGFGITCEIGKGFGNVQHIDK
jgi:hypothetical protein